MLTALRVKNLALVENIRVEFSPGLNVITGETGAGKSIMVGALGLLLGGRADRSLVRTGEDACGAEAAFDLKDPSFIDAILEPVGLPPCEDGQLVLRRIIKATGASQNIVNDSPVTLQVLKRIGEYLVDMHGPHDHQSLLKPDTQLEILDAFGHVWKERAAYETVFQDLCEAQRQRESLGGDEDDVAEQIDLLSYRVKEIEEAELKDGEEEEIHKEHAVLGNAQRIQELAGGVVQALAGDEGSAFDLITGVRNAMDELSRLLPEAEAWRTESESLTRQLQELNLDISRVVENIESSPVRLEWLDGRMATYQQMKKKYGPELSDVQATLETARTRLQSLETRGEQIEALDNEITALRKATRDKGKALRKKRKAMAQKLGKAVGAELKALGLAHGAFEVAFSEVEPMATGIDAVDFQFTPNVGEPTRSLKMIASSGEISRVMLATKTVLADHDRIPVLVFDEIDSNIGGETGSAIGKKLEEVASRHQVLCITHLPQVAVFGSKHFAVAKYVRDDRTFTTVECLEDETRVEELARMLGGRDLTSLTLDHAREMLQQV